MIAERTMPSQWCKIQGILHVNIFCPQCGKGHLAFPKDIGNRGRCHDCNVMIAITRPSSDTIHERDTVAVQQPYQGLQRNTNTDICPFCASPCSPIARACPSCGRTPDGTIGRFGL